MLDEGETTALALFNVLNAPTNPFTVTLEVEESGRRFLSANPAQFAISEEGETMTTITAHDNDDFAPIGPIRIMLRSEGGDVRFTPASTVAVSVANDDFYTVGFEEEEITLAEGMSANVRLIIDPAPSGADRVIVDLSVSDTGQIDIDEPTPSASGTSANFVVRVINDNDEEGEERYTVHLSLTKDNIPPTRLNPDMLTVTVPAHDEGIRIKVRVYLEGALP